MSNLEARGVAKKIWLAIIYMDLAIVGGGSVIRHHYFGLKHP